ncbi:5-oxoprolinase subunit B family protein [Pseudonocardia sediminis]|uniref:5-oxoprolinase subunit B family protein n=1 Tax=Pseudonocardia sediminis TaxID=1397368 RepID=UPI0010295D83|nr:allophanate hydrolase subunit 1 [Pseudonocardia sediminis]
MSRTLRPCGDLGLLAEVDDTAAVTALHAALREEMTAGRLAGVADLIRGARTVLVRMTPRADVRAVAAVVGEIEPAPQAASGPDRVLDIGVVYDGDDLDEVAAHTGLTVPEVVAAHTGQVWTVAFAGFAPGFGYLQGTDDRLVVPRRDESRISVPAGAVALAARFSGVYPRPSPGGWQLIGQTGERMWDLDRDPPALLTPGTRVRFHEEG